VDVGGAVAVLRAAGVPNPEIDVLWLRRLAPPHRFDDLVRRRAARQPLQHLLGTVQFRHLDLLCDGRALIPRPETEVTAQVAIDTLLARPPERRRVLDIGTGSGCIALSIALEVPGATVTATDVSDDALRLAAANAAHCGLGVEFRRGPLYEPLAGDPVDLVVSNPPYLAEAELAGLEPEVRDHDPVVALVAGPTGLEMLEQLVAGRPAGAVLVCEIAPHQEPWAARYGTVLPDLAGRPRVLRVDGPDG
jgi:release factor glutamine methyltransferase